MKNLAVRRRIALLAVPLALMVAVLALPALAEQPAAGSQVLSLPHASLWNGPRVFAADVEVPTDAMRVAINPATGELRRPTAAQVDLLAALEAPVFHRAFAASQIELADGTVMMALDPELTSYSVVRLGAAGQAGFACVDGPTHAAALSHEPSHDPSSPAAAGEEK